MSQAWERACDVAQKVASSSSGIELSIGVIGVDGSRHVLAGIGSSEQRENSLFLVASITKLLASTVIVKMVEQGLVSLTDRVIRYLPEFKPHNKHVITIHHLLTHTSGLPDTLPDDRQLRSQMVPMSEFFERTCRSELLFTPGSTARYASMGFVMLGEIVRRVTGMTLRERLDAELLRPLRMSSTWLGLDARNEKRIGDVVRVDTTLQQVDPSGDWNSRYWYTLGAPWGGMLSTTGDLLNYAEMILGGGVFRGQRVLAESSIRLMLENRLVDFADLDPKETRHRGWGLGWRLNWVNHRTTFGDLLPSSASGHWGATGTLLWIDRGAGTAAVILSNQPVLDDYSPLVKLSNALTVAANC